MHFAIEILNHANEVLTSIQWYGHMLLEHLQNEIIHKVNENALEGERERELSVLECTMR